VGDGNAGGDRRTGQAATYGWGVIRLDAATVLLQWAVGGLFFLWVTTRDREVGLGYGWLLRGTFGLMAVGALLTGGLLEPVLLRELASAGTALAAFGALALSVYRRKAGVSGQRAEQYRRSERVAAMTGIERTVAVAEPEQADGRRAVEFDPRWDLLAPAIGLIGLVAGAVAAADGAGDQVLAVARTVVGAAFLGCVSDAMLLGHWYLVQPGLPRRPILVQVRWLLWLWPLEVAVLLVPTGMFSVFTGSVDDGWGGMLGWMWGACAVTTLVLTFVTKAALKERQYSAVMAATGLLYLAILTAFGTDLVARAVLAG
jgi:hypothetical protein